MSKASIEAYIKGIENGMITNAKAKVYKYIKSNNNSLIKDIYLNAGLSEHTISARVSDLLDDGFIKIIGQKNSYSILSIVKDENEKMLLSDLRKIKRKEKAIKQLLKHNLEAETIECLKKELKKV